MRRNAWWSSSSSASTSIDARAWSSRWRRQSWKSPRAARDRLLVLGVEIADSADGMTSFRLPRWVALGQRSQSSPSIGVEAGRSAGVAPTTNSTSPTGYRYRGSGAAAPRTTPYTGLPATVSGASMGSPKLQCKRETPNGTPYTLSATNGDQNVHNGQAYGLKLPRQLLIDENKVRTQASLPNVWYSGRGNDFGCTPTGGHNLDIALPELATVPDGTNVTVTYKSSWDIEWDFDYGFTMVTTDGQNCRSLPSQKGYTTPKALNPNSSGCLNTHDNGLTGTSGSYRDGTFAADRNPAAPIYRDSPFLEDQYDLSSYAGEKGVVLRLSYATDPGLDRPGWFMDDIVVKAGNNVIYSSDFANEDPLRTFPGGCGEHGINTAAVCTAGWSLIDASAGSLKDHSYYVELRDRSGFDFNGRGEADRGAIEWNPGTLIEYTNESRGYGNNGGGMPPKQHYIDSQPQPGLDCGEALVDDPLTARDDTTKQCADAAFTAAAGDSHFDDDPATTGTSSGEPGDWIDNFADDSSDDGFWHFAYNCLSLDVTAMSGADANEALPSNLRANATIKALAGCAPFSYTGSYPNTAPVADAQVKPTTGPVNSPFIFDGSGSSDDITPTNQLKYEWDFDNNGTWDAMGQTVARSFSTSGTKTVKLRVTDQSTPAKSSIDTVTVTVTAAGKPDLTITQHTVNKTTVRKGDQVAFTATVANIGSATAGSSTTQWHLYPANGIRGRTLGNVATASIAASASRQVSLTINTSTLNPGRYKIRAYTDVFNTVSEMDQNNNAFYFYITVLRRN